MRVVRLTRRRDPSRTAETEARVPAVAAALAAALVVASVAGFVGTRQSLRDDDERSFRTRSDVIGRRVQFLTTDLVNVATRTGEVVRLARSSGTFNAARDVPVLAGPLLATVGVSAVRLQNAEPSTGGGPLDAAVLDARARNAPRMSAPVTRAGTRAPILVVPGYRDGRAPGDVSERLANGGPDLLVTIDPAAIVERAVTGARTLRLKLSDAGVPFGGLGPAARSSSSAVMQDVAVAGRVWTLTLQPQSRFAHAALLPWVILAIGLVLSGAAFAAAVFMQRAARRLQSGTLERERDLELIAEAGPLLQQSLDLAEVLPDFAVRLSHDFDLERLALLLQSEGALREVFAVGTVGGRRPLADLPVSPPGAAPAEEFVLRLHRGGRDVGALRIRPRGAISPSRMRALAALADLLAAALGNIQLYTDEQETVRRLQEVDRLKNDFVSTVSHELRTTTTAIAGFGDLLEQQWESLPDSTRRDFLGRVTRNAGTLRLLVDDMLDFSRLDRMTLSVAPVDVDLSSTVRSAVAQVASLFDRHDLHLDVAPGVRAWTDPRAVERVLTNLLSNAAKFSPPATRVTVTVRSVDDGAELSVSDQGPGVEANERDRIFARFYRGESEAARRSRGTGVGLAIVADLVARLDATVSVDDAPGGGARFVVRFPVAAAHTAAHAVPEETRDPIA